MKNKALESVIAAANALGTLAENPALQAEAAEAATRIYNRADTAQLIAEHAALVAVAEAAQVYCENFFGRPTPNEKAMLKSLARLAAVREGGAK